MTKDEVISRGAEMRPDLAKYVIAVKVGRTWEPLLKHAIIHARDQYDAGTVEMCQQRVGESGFLLLALPRRERIMRRETETFRWARKGYGAHGARR